MKNQLLHTDHSAPQDPLTRLMGRLDRLNLVGLAFDWRAGRCFSGSIPGELGRWLAATPVVELLRTHADLTAAAHSGVAEVFPGCRIACTTQHAGKQPLWTAAAVMFSDELLRSPVFASTCSRAGIDAGAVAQQAATFGAIRGLLPEGVATMLDWMRTDLTFVAEQTQTLNSYGHQLSEMYEEVGLLYRLGRSMNKLAEPEAVVNSICDDLRKTLPFSWIAVRFTAEPAVVPRLSGKMFFSGDASREPAWFDGCIAPLIPDLVADQWRLIGEGDAEPAVTLRCEVLLHPIVREQRVIGAIVAGNKRGHDPMVTSFETQLLDAAANFLSVFAENAGLYHDQRSLIIGAIQALTSSIDAKDSYTRGHSERVAYLAQTLATRCGMSEQEAERVRIAGLLHDVGKIGVPETVLRKAGRLSDDEFALIKLHPSIGYNILKDIPQLGDVLPGVLSHHERWDGRGYPNGVSGEAIPRIARVLALADTFDAMSSNRAYRAAMPREKVLAEILACGGTQFDPALAPLFVSLDFSEYDGMVARHSETERKAA